MPSQEIQNQIAKLKEEQSAFGQNTDRWAVLQAEIEKLEKENK